MLLQRRLTALAPKALDGSSASLLKFTSRHYLDELCLLPQSTLKSTETHRESGSLSQSTPPTVCSLTHLGPQVGTYVMYRADGGFSGLAFRLLLLLFVHPRFFLTRSLSAMATPPHPSLHSADLSHEAKEAAGQNRTSISGFHSIMAFLRVHLFADSLIWYRNNPSSCPPQ